MLEPIANLADRIAANAEEARRRMDAAQADAGDDLARRLEAANARLLAWGFPRRHLAYGWDGIAEAERAILRRWAVPPVTHGFVAWGATGVGKTAAFTVACRELWMAHRVESRMVHCVRLLDHLAAKGQEARDEVAAWTRCPVLVIDDLGAGEKPWPSICGKLELLLDDRSTLGLPTVATTNLGGTAELEKLYGAPCVGRLCDRELAYVLPWSTTANRRGGRTGWREV